MASEITKEDIQSLMANQERYTQQMMLIATKLTDIADSNKKIVEKITNGLTKDIIDAISKKIDEKEAVQADRRHEWGVSIKKAAEGVDRIWWFVGIVGLVIIIANVVIRGVDTQAISRDTVKHIIAEIKAEEHK